MGSKRKIEQVKCLGIKKIFFKSFIKKVYVFNGKKYSAKTLPFAEF